MNKKEILMRKALITQLTAYTPYNEQEARDKETILHMLRAQEDIFLRSNLLAHMTASAWVQDFE